MGTKRSPFNVEADVHRTETVRVGGKWIAVVKPRKGSPLSKESQRHIRNRRRMVRRRAANHEARRSAARNRRRG
jgi:hypothetical protein